MLAQREPQHLIIGKHMLAERHRRQRRDLFRRLLRFIPIGEKRQRVVVGNPPHGPENGPAIRGQRLEAVGIRQNDQRAFRQTGAPRELIDRAIAASASSR